MPWITVGALAVSAYMGHKASKRAEEGQDAALGMSQQEIDMQREGLDFSKEQYADWKARYDPVYDDMMAHIDDGLEPDYAAIAGDINASFDSAKGQEKREMRRYGIKPTDGAYNRTEREYAINKSAAHSGIRNKARQDTAGIKFNRLSGIHNTLQGVGTQAGNNVRASYGMVGNSMGAMSNQMMSNSNNNYRRDMSNASGWGQAIGGVDWAGAWDQAKGWFGGGGGNTSVGGYTDSDIALKDNIELIGQFGDVNIYTWTWNAIAKALGIKGRECGLLAQEHLESGHVRKGPHGYLQIDTDAILNQARAK